MLAVEHEDGAEGGERDHGDGNAGFDLLPEEEPGLVEGAADVQAGDADAGRDGHHDVKGEEDAEDEFLAGRDVDAPEEKDGQGDDHGIGDDVEADVEDGETKGALEVGGLKAFDCWGGVS